MQQSPSFGSIPSDTAVDFGSGGGDQFDLEMASARPGKSVASDLSKMNPLARCLISMDKKILAIFVALFFSVILFLGMKTSSIAACVLLICAVMLCFAVWLANWVISRSEGTTQMIQVSNAIRDGAEGYFTTQYGTIGQMSVILTFIRLFQNPLFPPAISVTQASTWIPASSAASTTSLKISLVSGLFRPE